MNEKEIRANKTRLIQKMMELKDAADEVRKEAGDLADAARAAGLTQHMMPLTMVLGQAVNVVQNIDNMANTLQRNMLAVALMCENIAPDDFMKTPEGLPVEDTE